MTLSKLTLRNAKRQAGDYLIYFATIILAAALLYAFNGLVFSQEIREISKGLASLPLMIGLASVVVVCIFGWLVYYATNFMLSRRSRELGLYILIGMENAQVSKMFFLENLAVGGAALVFGLLLGNLLFQVLRAVVLALFGRIYHFSFVFSIKTLGLTVVYFLMIYLYALRKSRKKIRNMKIRDLIYFDQQNEEAVIQTKRKRQILFVVSIFLGAVGTFLLTVGEPLFAIIGAGCVIVFLYGFFLSFASGIPEFFDRHPAQKFKGQNLLVFRTLTAKLGTMGIAMATISLLFTAMLISEGSGLVFCGIFQGRAAESASFDLYIGSRQEDRIKREYLGYIGEYIPVETAVLYPVYQSGNVRIMEYIEENITYYRYYEEDMMLKYSDYAILRALAGLKPVEIAPGEYLIHCRAYLLEILEQYGKSAKVGNVMLAPGEIYTGHLMQNCYGVGNGYGYIIVVPDEAVKGCEVHHWAYAAKTTEPVDEKAFAALEEIRDRQMEYNSGIFPDIYDEIASKAQAEAEAASATAVLVFPLYFLALALIMTAATILTIQQLSEAAHYRRQFELLQKLGMDRKEMEKALRLQFAFYYAMPAVPPVLVGVAFIRNLAGAVEPGILVGTTSPAAIAGTALVLFFLVYAVYIVTAYVSLRRDVLPK